MDAKAKTVQDILYSPDQFLVPFFQRHYSWKVSNWQRLWDDLRTLTTTGKGGKHFLGPLVCTPVNHMPGEVPVYLLIDGQQRLTTLTVLLAAVRDAAKDHQFLPLSEQITEGYLIHKWQKDLKRYKVVPRAGDREVLFAVVEGRHDQFTRRDGIVRAYRFFRDAISAFIEGDAEPKLRRLYGVATGQMSLVVVNIDGENPYEIFESLNSTGLPLEEADLIRNYVFMQVPLADQTSFNDLHWQPFESMFEATDDDPAVPFTSFYRDYLMRGGQYSRKRETFVDFKEMLKGGGQWEPPTLVAELRKYAGYELALRRPAACTDEALARILRRVALLKITTAHPLIMHLMSLRDAGTLSADEFLGCLHDLESFVIRRSICGESTRGYGEEFPAAIKEIKDAPQMDLQAYWVRRGWPDDSAFLARLADFALYRREPSKARVILEALEQAFGHKEGPPLEELSIEHVMPQSIDDDKNGRAWQEMLGEEWKQVHETWLDTLGNLTLTGYNPSLSNKAFEKKRVKLAESNVQLNKHFVGLESWDADSISARGKVLAERVAQIWARPKGPADLPASAKVAGGLAVGDGGDEDELSNQEYWDEFLKVLAKRDPLLLPKAVDSKPWLVFSAERAGARFATVVDPDEGSVSVELCLTSKYRLLWLRLLEQERSAIDAELQLGAPTDWEEDTPCKIVAFRDAVKIEDRGEWPAQHAWLADTLIKFRRVLGPRLSTSEHGLDFKKLLSDFWTAFDEQLAAQGSSLELESPKSGRWREVDLGRGVSLWMLAEPGDNSLGAGLQFSGKKGLAVLEKAKPKLTSLTSMLGTRVDVEEEASASYLSAYHFVRLAEKSNWPAYHQWLRHALETCKEFYDTLLPEQTP